MNNHPPSPRYTETTNLSSTNHHQSPHPWFTPPHLSVPSYGLCIGLCFRFVPKQIVASKRVNGEPSGIRKKLAGIICFAQFFIFWCRKVQDDSDVWFSGSIFLVGMELIESQCNAYQHSASYIYYLFYMITPFTSCFYYTPWTRC